MTSHTVPPAEAAKEKSAPGIARPAGGPGGPTSSRTAFLPRAGASLIDVTAFPCLSPAQVRWMTLPASYRTSRFAGDATNEAGCCVHTHPRAPPKLADWVDISAQSPELDRFHGFP